MDQRTCCEIPKTFDEGIVVMSLHVGVPNDGAKVYRCQTTDCSEQVKNAVVKNEMKSQPRHN